MIMVLGKLARQANSKKQDNLVDACGYLDLGFQLLEGPPDGAEEEGEEDARS
jgi:hypothetical protein